MSELGALLTVADTRVGQLVPYYEYIKAHKGDKEWEKWWETRNKWFEAYQVLTRWFNQQTLPPDNETAAKAFKVLKKHNQEINISKDKLEDIKREALIKVWKTWSDKKGIKKAEDKSEALETFNTLQREYGEMFNKFGYSLRLVEKKDEERNRRVHNFLDDAFGSLKERERNVLNLRYGLNFGDDHSSLVKALTTHLENLSNESYTFKDEKFSRLATLDFLLNSHEKNPKFEEWLRVLSDSEGRCRRQVIGYQKVRSDADKKVSESTYRNAGMRFVEKHGLEPVAQFAEIKLVDSLVNEFRDHCKTNPKYSKEAVRQLCNFMKREGDSDNLIECFAECCVKMQIDESTALVLLERAYPLVGQKKANNKTLYNARHVAISFIEEDMDPKPPQAPRGVVAEVVKAKKSQEI